jgi:hypothetical protein
MPLERDPVTDETWLRTTRTLSAWYPLATSAAPAGRPAAGLRGCEARDCIASRAGPLVWSWADAVITQHQGLKESGLATWAFVLTGRWAACQALMV